MASLKLSEETNARRYCSYLLKRLCMASEIHYPSIVRDLIQIRLLGTSQRDVPARNLSRATINSSRRKKRLIYSIIIAAVTQRARIRYARARTCIPARSPSAASRSRVDVGINRARDYSLTDRCTPTGPVKILCPPGGVNNSAGG